MSDRRCVRWTIFQGMCVVHEETVADAETGEPTRVRWGVADTIWTAPARTVSSPAVYGFISYNDEKEQEEFHRADPSAQAESRRSYKESIKP